MEKKYPCRQFFVIILLALTAIPAWGHGKKDHKTTKKPTDFEARMSVITKLYYKDGIHAILEEKCFNCHSTKTVYPWYHRIPGVKQLIDYDISEAQEHLEMTDGYPFKGHGDPYEDLEELKETLEKDKMPLWYYLILNSEDRLTPEEKTKIIQWADMSMKILEVKKSLE